MKACVNGCKDGDRMVIKGWLLVGSCGKLGLKWNDDITLFVLPDGQTI